jgi:hypothetical protein
VQYIFSRRVPVFIFVKGEQVLEFGLPTLSKCVLVGSNSIGRSSGVGNKFLFFIYADACFYKARFVITGVDMLKVITWCLLCCGFIVLQFTRFCLGDNKRKIAC